MAGYVHPESLVSTDWLARNLEAPDLRIVDATYYLPMQGKSARAEFETRHIPGAVFFDIDEIADENSKLPHMLPSPEKFAARMRKLGIGDGNRVVVYDSNNYMGSARVWWTLRVFGHSDVAVLDGGLAKWLVEG
jgi:thiosulfate/3-mercaptopyruvate sulfurtransferase